MANARLHEDLLFQLGQLDYATEALKQAEDRLAVLKQEVIQQRRDIDKYARSSKKEYDDYARMSHSVLSRASARFKGAVGRETLEERINKEEQEWLDALREVSWDRPCPCPRPTIHPDSTHRQESAAKSALATTEQEIQEMQDMVQDLTLRAAEHKQIQSRLDALLETVFAGPSDAFPEEDHAETEVYALEKEYREVCMRYGVVCYA
jgi:hypothetical protein